MAQCYVLYFDLNQFTYSCTRSSQKANHKVPVKLIISFQAILEILIIGSADHIFKECLLLYADEGHFPVSFSYALQIAIHGSQS